MKDIFYIKYFYADLSFEIDKNHTFNIVEVIKGIAPPLFLIIFVLGSIIAGIATPSEAASLGILGSLLISLKTKNINRSIILKCSRETTKLTSMIFMILIGATFFSLVFRGLEGEVFIQSLFYSESSEGFKTLIAVLILMFFLGFILDFIEIIFIVIPIFGPVLFTLGFDPIWIGILIAMVLQTSFLTPPFGFSIFYLRGVVPKEIETEKIYKGVIPFVLIQIILVLLMLLFPEIATFIPSLLLN